MPTLTKVLTAADLVRRPPIYALDLTSYVDLLQTVLADGVGATLTLAPDERQRTEKRRLSLAAKELGYRLVWRKPSDGQLRFVLAKPGERTPGGRPRRPRAEREAEQLVIDAVMTEDVADVTGTTAAAEANAPMPAPRRRRGRPRSS
jgi:hypothetical protein